MNIREIRRRLGKTIEDMSNETGISKMYLEAIEERRAIPTKKEIYMIAKSLNIEEETFYNSLKEILNFEKGNNIICDYIKEYGCFENAEYMDENRLKKFMYFVNDIWKFYNDTECSCWKKIGKSGIFDSSMELKEKLLKYLLKKTIQEKTIISFPYYSSNKAICWIEAYDYNDVIDEKPTIVLEVIDECSFINAPKYYIMEIESNILNTIGWSSSRNIRYVAKYISSRYNEEYEYRQIILQKNSEVKYEIINFKELLVNNKKERNCTYRVIIDANEIPDPFKGDKYADDRCSLNSSKTCKKCPFLNNIIPNEKVGCDYCRGIAKVWIARENILKEISDDDLRKIFSLADLEKNHNKIYKEFVQSCNDIEEAENLYEKIREFSHYDPNMIEPIYIGENDEEYGIDNGRHRIKIAQLLNLKIPVFLNTKRRLNAEIVFEE